MSFALFFLCAKQHAFFLSIDDRCIKKNIILFGLLLLLI